LRLPVVVVLKPLYPKSVVLYSVIHNWCIMHACILVNLFYHDRQVLWGKLDVNCSKRIWPVSFTMCTGYRARFKPRR
jgi:hypothetical protein